MRLPLAITAPLLAVALAGCARSGASARLDLAPEAMGLPAPPAMAAHLDIQGDLRSYSGPARMELKAQEPLHLLLEDFALAEPLEIVVESRDPVRFGAPAGERYTDTGTFLQQEDRLLLSLTRAWQDGGVEQIVVVGRLDPQPQATPRDWLRPGTRLFYGLTYDDKPITQLVPMGLMVTIGEATGDGERVLQWQADVDPDAQVDDTRIRYRTGTARIPDQVAEVGPAHSDTLEEGDRVLDHTAFFVPRQAWRNLDAIGAAAWHDEDAPGSGLLERVGNLAVTVQADDVLWRVPAVAARVADSGATYVIADHADDPLLLAAVRPGWSLKLLAIGRPRE